MISHKITDLASWWELSLTGASYGSKDIYTGTRHVIVDTGTSLLTLTKSSYDDFKSELESAGFFCAGSVCETFGKPCSDKYDELKDLNFMIDETMYTIPPAGYLTTGSDDVGCYAMVSHLPNSQDMYILGDTFIRNFYPIFNYDDYTVTLAMCVDCLGTITPFVNSPN